MGGCGCLPLLLQHRGVPVPETRAGSMGSAWLCFMRLLPVPLPLALCLADLATCDSCHAAAADGYDVDYLRVPVTDEKAPKPNDFQLLIEVGAGGCGGTSAATALQEACLLAAHVGNKLRKFLRRLGL